MMPLMILRRCVLIPLLLFLTLAAVRVSGQQAYIDSIKILLKDNPDDSSRLDYYFKLAKSYRNLDAYKGLSYIDSSLRLAQKIKAKGLMAEIINESGVLYRKLNLFEEALDQHQKALIEFENLQDSMGIAYAYANLGNVFLTIAQLDKALEYNLKSLEIKRLLNDSLQIAYSLRTTAIAYQSLKQHDSAIACFSEALEIYKEAGDNYDLGNIYYHLGDAYLQSGKSHSLALHYLGKALNYFNQIKNYFGSSLSKFYAGKAYLQLDELEKAESYFAEALTMAKKSKTPKMVMDIYFEMAKLNAQQNNYEEALKLYRDATYIKDSLYSETFSKNIAEIAEKYKRDVELARLRDENVLMKNEQKLKSAYLVMLILGIVFALIVIALLYWRNREKKKHNHRLEEEIRIKKINERKLIESEKKLTEANATKDKFFSLISHDLKSPFGGMKGLIEMLESGYESFDDESRMEIITEINKSANGTYALLEDLLAWSQTQRGTMSFKPEKIDLGVQTGIIVNYLLPVAQKKNISLINNVKDDLTIRADMNMLKTIIRNLLSNAIKFTPGGGEVTLSAMHAKDGFVAISVSDNGIGIEKENLTKIFKIEEKFNNRGTDNEPGTGLGLIICKEFVQMHKGVINIESEAGKGSAFTFTMPVA